MAIPELSTLLTINGFPSIRGWTVLYSFSKPFFSGVANSKWKRMSETDSISSRQQFLAGWLLYFQIPGRQFAQVPANDPPDIMPDEFALSAGKMSSRPSDSDHQQPDQSKHKTTMSSQ